MSLSGKGKFLQYSFWLILLLFVFSPLLKNLLKDSAGNINKTNILMDTFIRVDIFDTDKDRKFVNTKIDSVFSIFRCIESYFDINNSESILNKIEENSGQRFTEMPPDFKNIIDLSVQYGNLTHGLFDITIKPIVKLWNIPNTQNIPAENDIKNLLKLVNYKDIKIDKNLIMLEKESMRLDVGGVAKGYAVEKSLEYLKSAGFKNIIIDAGGDLGISIEKDEKAKVNIAHPRQPDLFWGWFYVKNNGIATSGDYQRCVFIDGKRYHHILDPVTGYPSDNCISVTIVAPNSTIADILATAVFVMKPEEGIEFIDKLENIEGIILYKEGNSIKSKISEGMKNYNFTENSSINEKVS